METGEAPSGSEEKMDVATPAILTTGPSGATTPGDVMVAPPTAPGDAPASPTPAPPTADQLQRKEDMLEGTGCDAAIFDCFVLYFPCENLVFCILF